jgi:hypothetical protein
VAAADAGERQRIAMASDTVEGEEEIRRKMWLQTVGGVGSKPWRLEAHCARHELQLEEEPWRVGPGVMRRAG